MTITTECSECFTTVNVNLDEGTVTTTIPSNGKRGSLHVPAHEASTEGSFDGDLLLWECPRCGYADSTYTDPATREALT